MSKSFSFRIMTRNKVETKPEKERRFLERLDNHRCGRPSHGAYAEITFVPITVHGGKTLRGAAVAKAGDHRMA